MTVILHFVGGPKDGGYRRISSEELTVGYPVTRVFPSFDKRGHRYTYKSKEPWDENQSHVTMRYEGVEGRF